MRYRQLGHTGLFVSELCLGTMTFGGKGALYEIMGKLQQDEVNGLFARAFAAGVNFFDTADVYSDGVSEELLGHALKTLHGRRSDYIVATKAYGRMGPGPNDIGASRGRLMDAVVRSLERLQTDHIDLFQIHAQDLVTPTEEMMRALEDVVARGMVRYIGCSNWQAWKIVEANALAERRGWSPLASVQSYYSLAGRDIEREIVPMAQSRGVGILVWSPLAYGILSGKFDRESNGPPDARRTNFDFPPVNKELVWRIVDALREIGTARGASPARVAIAWTLSRPFVCSVTIGVKSLAQLDDNLAACELNLLPEEIARLDELSALTPEYPGWMIPRQNTNRRPT